MVLGAILTLAVVTQLGPIGHWSPWLARRRAAIGSVWPESWAFFAHEPDSTIVIAYRPDTFGDLRLMNEVQGSSADRGGLGRYAQDRLLEIAGVAARVPASAWASCAPASDCVATAESGPAVTVTNPSDRPSVCGSVVLTRATPPRWSAGANAWSGRWNPTAAIRVVIECP